MFVNRIDELNAIQERLNNNNFELIILYGRRRIGKTRLILESIKDMEHIYFFATESDNLKHFKIASSRVIPETAYAAEDWESLFNFLKDKIVIIDEFPNMIKENSTVVSEFQKIVDTKLMDTKTKLILLGSSISMMGNKVLSYQSPLYGRKTGVIKLKSLGFKHLLDFFPKANLEKILEIYGISDGIPYYLEKIGYPFWDWLEKELFRPDTFLKYEIDFLMKYEFEDIGTYKHILEAIAFGKNTPVEIRNFMGVRHSDITPYLRNLMEVEFIERAVPVLESEKSKLGRYFLKDNFLRFWFRFIYPNLSAIEEGIFSIDEIKSEYNTYLGRIFEKAAKEFIIEMNNKNTLPFRLQKLGRWWRKGEEIDLVGLMEKGKKKQAIFFEVKWSTLRKGEIKRILTDLVRKSELLGLKDYEKHFGIIAKKTAEKKGLIFDLKDFNRVF